MRPPTVAFVANEAVFPIRGGGTVRISGLLEQISASIATVLVQPSEGGPLPESLSHVTRHVAGAPRREIWRGLGSPRPRLGWATTGVIDLRTWTVPPSVVMVSHSYVTPMVRVAPGTPVVVDFANIEVDRERAGMDAADLRERAVSTLEWAKANWWEPRAARRARTVVAVGDGDADRLTRWGARDVIVVPNTADTTGRSPSPATGVVGVLASGHYRPNREGLQWLVREVWPRVIAARPDSQLTIAGWGTEELDDELAGQGVRVIGPVEDAKAFYDSCAVVAAPIARGGGSQLKVVEALGRGRIVVATPHSAAPFLGTVATGLVVAATPQDFSRQIVTALSEVPARHRQEEALRRAPIASWEAACAPLVERLITLATRTDRRG